MKKVFLFLCVFVLALFVYSSPTGSWFGVFVLMALISLGSFYLGFCSGPGVANRMIHGAIAAVFLLGLVGVSARVSIDKSAEDSVANLIQPYPNYVSFQQVTKRVPGGGRAWSFSTEDDIGAVRAYFEAESNFPGWQWRREMTRFILTREETKIEISLSQEGTGTHIIYAIWQPK